MFVSYYFTDTHLYVQTFSTASCVCDKYYSQNGGWGKWYGTVDHPFNAQQSLTCQTEGEIEIKIINY